MTRSTGFVDIVAMVLAVFTCKIIIIILYLNSKVLNNITIQNLKKDWILSLISWLSIFIPQYMCSHT